MKRALILLAAAALALSFAAYATAQEPKAKPAHEGKMPSGMVSETTELKATVDMIDQKTRIVTLRGEDGTAQDFVAGPEVKNLAQVKPGDQVIVKYVEALAWEVKKQGSATPGVAVTEGVVRAEPGQKPGGAGGRKVTVTATIAEIDTATQHVTLKGPEGKLFRVKARNPKNLEAVKVGDLVEITYTQALAIAVEPAAKK